MSNIAGKAYAMNLVTPVRKLLTPIAKLYFWSIDLPPLRGQLGTLRQLPMLHSARWVLLRDRDFPRPATEQPREQLRHSYMLFLSHANGSWEHTSDRLASAVPKLLHRLWFGRDKPRAGAESMFQQHVERDRIDSDYFYSSTPLASASDLRSARRVKQSLCAFVKRTHAEDLAPAEFLREYHVLLKQLQPELGLLQARAREHVYEQDSGVIPGVFEERRRAQ